MEKDYRFPLGATVDGLIAALQEVRRQVGGDACVVFPDNLALQRVGVSDDAVVLSDVCDDEIGAATPATLWRLVEQVEQDDRAA